MRFLSVYLKENEEKFSLEALDSFPSLAKKVQYAKSKLKKLGEGSSRIVFDLNDGYVLKLAKNIKGQEQNMGDGDWGKQKMYPDLLPELKDKDESDDVNWLVVKKAEKITEKQFQSLTKLNFKTFSKILSEQHLWLNGKIKTMAEDSEKIIEDSELLQNVIDLVGSFDMLPGDLTRISSWGKIGNNAVIVDCGLSQTVYNTHYRKK